MLSQLDKDVATIYISSTDSNNLLMVEVLLRDLNIEDPILNEWKSWVIDSVGRHMRIVVAHHILCNYYSSILNQLPPFNIYIRSSSNVATVRQWVRNRIKLTPRNKELWILDTSHKLEIKALSNKPNIQVLSESSLTFSKSPISVILGKSYSAVNKSNKFIPLNNK